MKTPLLAAVAALALTPAVAQAEAFNGPYAGIELGWEDTDGVIGDGFTYGVIGGYNFKATDRLVLGVEGKVGLSTADRDITTPTSETEYEAGRSLGIAGRIGYLAAPNTLFYGKVGYENIRTKIELEDATGKWKNNFNTDAVVVGGGLEYALTQQATLRVAYDYANGEDGFERHQVKTGVAFHF